MRKVVLGALALTFLGVVGIAPLARADGPSCKSSDQVNQSIAIGVVCAGGDPAGPSGHAYVDGNDDNPGAAAGYIGGNNDEEEAGVVGCASGNYGDDTDPSEGTDPTTGEVDPVGDGDADPNVIVDPTNPSPETPDPASPCTPSAP